MTDAVPPRSRRRPTQTGVTRHTVGARQWRRLLSGGDTYRDAWFKLIDAQAEGLGLPTPVHVSVLDDVSDEIVVDVTPEDRASLAGLAAVVRLARRSPQ